MNILKTLHEFFRFKISLGRAMTRPRPMPQYSEDVQKDWDRIGAEINKLGNKITAEQLNSIFNSGKDTK